MGQKLKFLKNRVNLIYFKFWHLCDLKCTFHQWKKLGFSIENSSFLWALKKNHCLSQ